MEIMQKIGLVAAVVLPLWNIPMIVRIVKRKSSEDISLSWALGVWICFILMAPSGFNSTDLVWKLFNMINLVLFSCVALVVVIYRKKEKQQ